MTLAAGLVPAHQASPSGYRGKERDRLIVAAHAILARQGVVMSPSKVHRLVQTHMARDAQRRAVLANPDVARVIAYADPTGETAVNRVLKERGR